MRNGRKDVPSDFSGPPQCQAMSRTDGDQPQVKSSPTGTACNLTGTAVATGKPVKWTVTEIGDDHVGLVPMFKPLKFQPFLASGLHSMTYLLLKGRKALAIRCLDWIKAPIAENLLDAGSESDVTCPRPIDCILSSAWQKLAPNLNHHLR